MSLTENRPKSILYVIATPIGNPEDITLRAIRILKEADIIIGEERKETAKLLRSLDIRKEIILMNEHSSKDEIKELLNNMLLEPKIYAQVSDCGTPGYEDPGTELVALCRDYGINVIPIPGASSLMTLIMASGINMKHFYYHGFLSPKREERQKALKDLALRFIRENLVLLDTPYRLSALLDDCLKAFGPHHEAILGYKLTMPEEKIIRFQLKEYPALLENLPKGEFVLILKGK